MYVPRHQAELAVVFHTVAVGEKNRELGVVVQLRVGGGSLDHHVDQIVVVGWSDVEPSFVGFQILGAALKGCVCHGIHGKCHVVLEDGGGASVEEQVHVLPAHPQLQKGAPYRDGSIVLAELSGVCEPCLC